MIFVDPGAWIARSLPDDCIAARANGVYPEIARGAHGALVTSNFVIDEAVTFLRIQALKPQTAVLCFDKEKLRRRRSVAWERAVPGRSASRVGLGPRE